MTLVWALASAPASAVAQLHLLVLTCRIRAGVWPRPYVPDVDAVALPLQQPAFAVTVALSLAAVVGVPLLCVVLRVARGRAPWGAVVLALLGFALLLWVVRADPIGRGFPDWAWD